MRITTTNICGSDLHLYETLGPFMNDGDILGHEPMGIVEAVGSDVTNVAVGDRVVMPFQISCGHSFMCDKSLYTQCETTQVRDQGIGAALFGFSNLYGAVPGGQAEFLRVPQAQDTTIKVPDGPPDERFVDLSDVLPTAWQSVEYAGIPDGGSVVVLGLGPTGAMACRIAAHRGHRVIGVDLVPERFEREHGGTADPLPMLTLFDKQIQLRMGQANILKWVPEIMPQLTDQDPLRDSFHTHQLPLSEAPHAYEIFQKKQDGAIKILLKP